MFAIWQSDSSEHSSEPHRQSTLEDMRRRKHQKQSKKNRVSELAANLVPGYLGDQSLDTVLNYINSPDNRSESTQPSIEREAANSPKKGRKQHPQIKKLSKIHAEFQQIGTVLSPIDKSVCSAFVIDDVNKLYSPFDGSHSVLSRDHSNYGKTHSKVEKLRNETSK